MTEQNAPHLRVVTTSEPDETGSILERLRRVRREQSRPGGVDHLLADGHVGELIGRTEPRLFTPPLRELTPDTSYGFAVIEFARDILRTPLDPWEEWAVIHGGELLPDGRPRFRILLIIVARQNGKTLLLAVLSIFWLWVDKVELVLGTSGTKVDYAREAWETALNLVRKTPLIKDVPTKGGVRTTNGEVRFTRVPDPDDDDPLDDGGRYMISAANRRGGRTLTIARLILDELREHDSWRPWAASVPATNAVWGSQIIGITNQGDDTSVVLDSLRKSALGFIESGEGDERLGLLEWSAPDGSLPTDRAAHAYANPKLGLRIDPDSLMADAVRAQENGGDELAQFKTENLCMRVHHLDAAVDPDDWDLCGVDDQVSMAEWRDRVALVLDVSMAADHAALVAGVLRPDGVVQIETVEKWSGRGCTTRLRAELPALVRKVRPQVFGWFPSGPAAVVAADMAKRKGWPPAGVKVEEIRTDVPAVCMALPELVHAGLVQHPNDPMINAHVKGAEKLWQGEVWRFARRGAGPVNAAYAVAGVAHLARTMPSALSRPRVVTAPDD